ncbi:Dam family site-specific DNA-(adenine-N6)-methyltransferase [Clostridium sp. BL-8]|uniref:Dam family site-specific DNA-(adenine-N6)-methyltransferase n=1 Tax=Clostridium sp. BL-8 TaxID=349938 RepID=UPI00098CBD7C|nr:Dam family site-specific DNA-(adenine-N6)-methyltransferase [Clostridium sp. BL-8]
MARISATKIAEKLDISRSYLYYLKDHGVFKLKLSKKGHIIWNDEIVPQIKKYLDSKKVIEEKPKQMKYKTSEINNRRYLGNKYKLIPFIIKVVNDECKDINTVADIFSGTGAVASAFSNKKIITNDIMYSNYICNYAWFGSESFSQDKIVNIIVGYNSIDINEENYMTQNFANTFFSLKDCAKIGYIREDIENLFNSNKINLRERAILIMSLMYAMDKIANTCGHYDAYRKGINFDKHLELYVPTPDANNNKNNMCFNTDANELVRSIEADLVYIDPPYNSRQYCDAYHLLENVARWEKPAVHGVARKMDRTLLKSNYCTIKATEAFEDLVNNIKAKYILFSYNNMAEKGNERSNAKISDKDIFRILSKKGKIKVFSEEYKAFTTGKSNISGNEERLFLCECYDDSKDVIASPLNYIGGKYKLLQQILPHFPSDIECFIDLFCGGCNVGVNVNCSKVIFNDLNENLINLFNTFKSLDKKIILELINKIIDKYELSRSNLQGYSFYGCESTYGLGRYNKDKFLKLREDFNNKKTKDHEYYIMLYVLIVFSFNNQIRFNKSGKFNLPVGKRDFNSKMETKLVKFIDRIKSSDYSFCCLDFRSYGLEKLDDKSFVYVDPPYLITCATYNEQEGWNEKDEKSLLSFLDRIHEKGLRFALSNVLRSKGKENNFLIDWLNRNSSKYKVIYLDYNYSNSNYQTKDKVSNSEEVLIINY